MTFITLTTDWGNDDFYIGAVKGLLYSKCQGVQVVDITHKIENYKYTQAAFVLKNTFAHFPKGTIHLIGINSDLNNQQPPICILAQGHYFIGAANGIFNTLFSSNPEKVIVLNETPTLKNSSFPELTLFAEAAAHIINGGQLSEIGTELKGKYRLVEYMPAYEDDSITGSVIYIDSYQNIITNISKELFHQIGKNRKFTITVKKETYSVQRLSHNYSEVESGDLLALFNSLDLLEMAIRNGKMAELIDVKLNSPVTVKFR
ncbi:MAG TPA: hypothetical protein DCQ26_03695 [Marinilabiliales bacterium]|jgi:hypothetical protein|nr:MAG: hypothetical protein A2W95_09530 [Bacteroidetes bacterium GWA2_40_14]OFX58211.1 MAG: hypothetical protein A2W84_03945 [Bacteroidetes bacterium GWC2_40_13]OFX71365.1 MAG: hypothetical protein A2W96_14505 [Bacteroidetes bacterium GWD2_40_43]OFX91440.1 MAG: hypothetical protein A2W97_04350 [Bacteroidetes bacterium GWE2_40_63]OFY19509.1 MAG: hypothetical protein A2W88_02230 [Bacteroidetes bacterium GWF2_40_13]OFZ32226.1 MAG: hypothetical protein A2437_19650 [Bacteroidetes bacterium RIFOXYC